MPNKNVVMAYTALPRKSHLSTTVGKFVVKSNVKSSRIGNDDINKAKALNLKSNE
jgi:hypothetical protein